MVYLPYGSGTWEIQERGANMAMDPVLSHDMVEGQVRKHERQK